MVLDHDGIPNGVEMVLGGNPATGMDSALMPTIELVTNPTATNTDRVRVYVPRAANTKLFGRLNVKVP